jgi:hypothetical protein
MCMYEDGGYVGLPTIYAVFFICLASLPPIPGLMLRVTIISLVHIFIVIVRLFLMYWSVLKAPIRHGGGVRLAFSPQHFESNFDQTFITILLHLCFY